MYQYIHWFCISGVGCWHRIIIHINRFRCVYFLLINYIPFIQLTPKWITRNCNACDLWRVLGGQSAAKSAFWFLILCENKDSFLIFCVCVRVCVRVRKKAVEKRLSSGGSSLFFLAGFVGGRPLFFLSGACVCCLVMMIKHAGRKYSIPTKPKNSYSNSSKQQSEWRQKRRRQAARYRFPGKTSTATIHCWLHSSFVPCTALIRNLYIFFYTVVESSDL